MRCLLRHRFLSFAVMLWIALVGASAAQAQNLDSALVRVPHR